MDLARHQACRRHAKEASSHSHGHRGERRLWINANRSNFKRKPFRDANTPDGNLLRELNRMHGIWGPFNSCLGHHHRSSPIRLDQTNQRREKLTTIRTIDEKYFLLRNYLSPFRDESRSRPLWAPHNEPSSVLNQMKSKKKHRLKPKRVKKTNKRLIGAYRHRAVSSMARSVRVDSLFFNKIKKNLINHLLTFAI